MGDVTNYDKLRRRRRLKRAFKRTTWMLLLAVLATGAFLLWSVGYYLDAGSRISNYLSSMRPGAGYPVSLDDMDVSGILPMGSDVAVVTRSGSYIYNQYGARLNTCLNSFSNPVTKAAGGKLLTFDSLGQQVRIYTKTELLYDIFTSGRLLGADICATGAFAIAQTAKGALGEVVAYSAKSEELYRWNTSQGYLSDLRLNPRGTVFAAAGVNAPDGVLTTRIHFHRLETPGEDGTAVLADELLLSMMWNESDQLQVITDRALYLFDQTGKTLVSAELPGEVTNFCNSPEGAIYLACADEGNPRGAVVTGFDSALRTLGSWSSPRKVFQLQYSNGRLFILTEGKLYLGDRALNQIKERESGADMTAICAIGNHIYGITGEGLVRQGI